MSEECLYQDRIRKNAKMASNPAQIRVKSALRLWFLYIPGPQTFIPDICRKFESIKGLSKWAVC